MARWGVSHTGASIVRAEVQIDGPDLVSSVTTHGEAKDRPAQSALDVGMRRRDCHEGQRTERTERTERNGVLTLLWTPVRLVRPS